MSYEWTEFFMNIAKTVAKKSKDPRTKVGAVIADPDLKVVGLGYNGFPKGIDENNFNWTSKGEWLQTKYPYVVHAELNAILNSSTNLKNCIMFTTHYPCCECAKAIIQSGIKAVIYLDNKKPDEDVFKASKILFNLAKIKVWPYDNSWFSVNTLFNKQKG